MCGWMWCTGVSQLFAVVGDAQMAVRVSRFTIQAAEEQLLSFVAPRRRGFASCLRQRLDQEIVTFNGSFFLQQRKAQTTVQFSLPLALSNVTKAPTTDSPGRDVSVWCGTREWPEMDLEGSPGVDPCGAPRPLRDR